jgi:hypothetical protein
VTVLRWVLVIVIVRLIAVTMLALLTVKKPLEAPVT